MSGVATYQREGGDVAVRSSPRINASVKKGVRPSSKLGGAAVAAPSKKRKAVDRVDGGVAKKASGGRKKAKKPAHLRQRTRISTSLSKALREWNVKNVRGADTKVSFSEAAKDALIDIVDAFIGGVIAQAVDAVADPSLTQGPTVKPVHVSGAVANNYMVWPETARRLNAAGAAEVATYDAAAQRKKAELKAILDDPIAAARYNAEKRERADVKARRAADASKKVAAGREEQYE